ncbi:unnamed protein product [Phytomonas sp. EM1]|nr:unnamed protein product [Phytomonas sp. EM1]|eukprot:CCW61077.1 unnamed protein product [Phytomonas sp. isolate EM1]
MAMTLRTAAVLARGGFVDLFNTSVGMPEAGVPTMAGFVPQAAFARASGVLKESFRQSDPPISIPVVATHRIHSLAVAAKLVEAGVCDLVGLARPLLADAGFIAKAQRGEVDRIIPCIACNHCVNRLYKHQRVGCAVNPISGWELERGNEGVGEGSDGVEAGKPGEENQTTNGQTRKELVVMRRKAIAVVGAGAAGVSCALTLARRGHDVTLFERAPVIGGQLHLAKQVPGKAAYNDILVYWTKELQKSTINVRLETEFTREEVARNHNFFHAIVLANGSIPRPITSHVFPGASESGIVVPFSKILDGSVRAGRRVAILGNGAISHDVASFLLHDPRVARRVELFLHEWGVNLEEGTILPPDHARDRAPRNNRDVILFNKPDKDADLSWGTGWAQKLWIRNHGGTILNHALIEMIDPHGIHISTLPPDNRKFYVECDTIVWCNGMLPNFSVGTWIYEWMKDGARKRGEMIGDFSIYSAGSCRDSYTGDGHGEQDLMQAVHEGYEIGSKI